MDSRSYQERSDSIQPDPETLSANTEDSLLNTRNSSETNSLSKDVPCCKRKKKFGCNWTLPIGILLTTIGVTLLIWTPFNIMMKERLRMLPGFPAFEWWEDPPEEVLLNVYIFNVTNSEAFLNGTDVKLNIEEIGPIVYREKLIHKNITFNDNGTLSYVAQRTAIYLPEFNTIDLNKTLILPNFAVLGMASYLHDASFFSKFGFNIMLRSVKSPLFVETSIYNFMWNMSDPILTAAQKITPNLVPFLNMGILERIYSDFEDGTTVFIGPENGDDKFFLIDKYHGSSYLWGHGSSCPDLVVNSTEGVLYPQYLNENSSLKYWRKTLCKVIPLHFEKQLYTYGVIAYKFTMYEDGFDRTPDLSTDCYAGSPALLNGLSDVSKCYHNIPMAASFPHFLYGDEGLKNMVTGLKPNKSIHESFAIIEPITGVPVEAYARSQSNLVVRKLIGFNPVLQKFSDTVIPMFWLEYNQVGLPDYICWLMYFTVVLVPNYQYVFISILLLLGTVIIVYSLTKHVTNTKNRRDNLECNKSLHFEQQQFLKRSS